MKKMIPLALAAACVAMPALAADMATDIKMKQEKHFLEIDTNNDKKINKAEHDAYSQMMFDESDTNNDNLVSLQEMTDYKMAKMAKEGSMSPAAGGNPKTDPTAPGNVDPKKHPY